jgi:hypothetical protein
MKKDASLDPVPVTLEEVKTILARRKNPHVPEPDEPGRKGGYVFKPAKDRAKLHRALDTMLDQATGYQLHKIECPVCGSYKMGVWQQGRATY